MLLIKAFECTSKRNRHAGTEQCKLKSSGTPTCSQKNIANPVAAIAAAVFIEYTVLYHLFENTDLPPSWLQFCILFKKEKPLVPFDQTGSAINLDRQFIDQKRTKYFTHYCSSNLNYRIAPVNRADKKGPQGPKIIVWGLHFNSAWAITMPAPDPKP
jgi:hypothetical protein